MKKSLLTAILIITTNLCWAYADHEGFQQRLEEMIALDQGLDDVVVYYSKGSNFDDEMEILEIKYEKNNTRFIAVVRSIDNKESRIQGRFEEAQLVPVLINPVNEGEAITQENITFKKYPKNRDLGKSFKNLDSIIGRFAKHKIQADRPLTINDLGEETVVTRGQTVKMIFQKDALLIETVGITLDAGGQNEIIRVKNLDSSQVVRAKVKDPETVLVGPDSSATR